MFSEDKMSQTGQKNQKVLIKNLFTQTHLTVLNAIKRKTRAGKAYAYRMFLSFKTSVTYK